MARAIQLNKLPEEINDSVYSSEKYPLLLDSLGQACQFLRYRARYLSVLRKGDFERETLRKAVVQALHNGAWLVLDFEHLAVDLDSLFDEEHFPEVVLSPQQLFLEENYQPLLRPSDEFAGKVTYEHQSALAQGLQDRTRSHAPERVADVDTRFSPKEAFRLVVATRAEEVPPELADRLCVLKVTCSERQAQERAGIWAGREPPRAEKSSEQKRLDSELTELAFDGDLAQVQRLLAKEADPRAKDSHGNDALSEAACNGHLEVAKCLIDWKAPLGSDPNSLNIDGRSGLHRAAFQGHAAVVQLLLERGSDPRVKDRHGEVPFDMASNDETRAALTGWDVAKTDKLKEERRVAQDAEDERNVRNDEERLQLAKRRKMQRLAELAEEGDKDELEIELMDIPRAQISAYRDDRGNTVLHVAAEHGRVDCVTMLIDKLGMDKNVRESKGWTPIAIAAFRGHKSLCQALLERKADPLLENAYRKDALAVAKDDEIREVLKLGLDSTHVAAASSGAAAPSSAPSSPEPAAKAKAKGKAKAKARSGSSSVEPKAKAKGAAKARSKSRPR